MPVPILGAIKSWKTLLILTVSIAAAVTIGLLLYQNNKLTEKYATTKSKYDKVVKDINGPGGWRDQYNQLANSSKECSDNTLKLKKDAEDLQSRVDQASDIIRSQQKLTDIAVKELMGSKVPDQYPDKIEFLLDTQNNILSKWRVR